MARLWYFPLIVTACACTDAPHSSTSSLEASAAREDQAPAPHRHVVLLTIDTLRADALGVYGGPARTPHLNALAEGGRVFERCVSASMLTNPSHASMMTSLYPKDHGVYDNESGIQDGVRTLASALRRHGYHTAAVVGFPHLNPNVSNLGQGFNVFEPATASGRRAAQTSTAALALIDNAPPDRSWFVWAHYTDPHAPYEPPFHRDRPNLNYGRSDVSLKHVKRVAPGFQRRNGWFRGAFSRFKSSGDFIARYVEEVEAADAGVGALLRGLHQRGLLGQTLVVVTSDHGENLGENDLFFHHGGLYPQTIHVPLILAGPGWQPGREAHVVSTVDIAPTIVRWVGAPRWEPMRGRDLAQSASGPGWAYAEHMRSQLVAVYTDAAAHIEHRADSRQFPSYPFTRGTRESFVLNRRFGATPQPLTGQKKDQLESAAQRYLGNGLFLTARQARDQDRESLRALGYIE